MAQRGFQTPFWAIIFPPMWATVAAIVIAWLLIEGIKATYRWLVGE